MISRRFRNVAIFLAILALVAAACGPQATPTPAPTEEVVETEEVAAATDEATEEAVEATEEAVVEATEEAVEATEEAVVEATEEAVEATEEAVVEATEEAMEATEEAVVEATEEAVEATEEAVVEATEEAMEATEEAVVEATEEAMEATEEPMAEMTEEAMSDAVAFDDEAGFTFSYPAAYELQAGAGVYRLTMADALLVVVDPTAYAAVLGGVTFEDNTAALSFYLDRTGYTVGEPADMAMAAASVNVSLPRRNLVGYGNLVDLGEGNFGVVIELASAADAVPSADGASVQSSMSFTPPPPPEEEAPVEEEAAAPTLTILGLAIQTDGLDTLATALVRGGFASTFNSEGPFTVFAPTDDAFAAALEALGLTADELLANRELLSSVLSYHVVEGAVLSGDLTDGMEVTTLNGASLTINVGDAGVTVTDAQGNTYNVVTADVAASNGVVHVIDGVLMPPSGE